MAKTNQPAAATITKVQDQLGATPRSTAALANASGLSPATTRKALTVLATEGLAAKNEQGDWHVVTTGSPAKPSDLGTPVPEATPENTKALAKATAKKAPAKKAAATKKAAARPEAPASPLTGVAEKLAALGLSDKLARHDAQLVELLAEHGPLTKAQVLTKVPGLSDWAFRRMAEGRHSDRSFSPLLSVTGQGKTRTYTLSQQGTKVVGR
ncbi:MAG TPA: hypothetical protein VK611_17015 [Acidimicrobiales bacterium]|nr:hypothetical protein [Acidimicrobiales bacterium]